MTPWLVILAAGVGSYAFRVSMLVLAARFGVPPVLERAARLAVPTAFAGLAATSLAQHAGATGGGGWAPIAAVAVAIVAVRRTGSSHAALLAGMPALWLFTALGH
jgi:branched-subunit amino acid transport protein